MVAHGAFVPVEAWCETAVSAVADLVLSAGFVWVAVTRFVAVCFASRSGGSQASVAVAAVVSVIAVFVDVALQFTGVDGAALEKQR